MIVRKLDEVEKTDRKICTEHWDSVRLLLKGDGMGYSVHMTTIYEGAELPMEYRNHYEAVYCVSGEGEIEDLANGKIHQIAPGTIYALNNHDKHILRARKELKLVCVFNPPLNGKEVHDAEGVYPLEAEECSA